MNKLLYLIWFGCSLSLWLGSCRKGENVPPLAPAEQMVQDWEISSRGDYLYFSQQIDSILPFLEDSLYYYRALLLKAKTMVFLSDNDSTFALLEKVQNYCEQYDSLNVEYRALYAKIHNARGNVLARMALIDSARKEFLVAYHWCEPTKSKMDLLNVSMNLADAYVRGGEYAQGAFWFRKALAFSDSLQMADGERYFIYMGLAQVYMELRDFEQCDYYYNLVDLFFDKMTLYEKHVYLNNRGNSYYFRQDYQTALGYFQRVLGLLENYPEMEFERNLTHINLADIYLSMGQLDKAYYHLNMCRDFFKKVKNNSALYYMDTQLIELALLENDLPLAKKRLQEAVKPDYIEPNMVHIRNRYLQEYFEKAGDFKRAYEYQNRNRFIDDSTRNERIKMKAAEIALRYQQDSTLLKKELLLNQKQNEVLRLNQWIYLGLSLALLGSAVSLICFLYWKKRRDKLEWGMRTDITSLKLKNVRNCISPHFIFNILNQVILSKKGSEEEQKLMNLVKLIRYNLTLTDRLTVTLSDEIDFVKTYLALQRKSLEPDFEYTIHIDASIDEAKLQIPAMLLQIPVENAVKYALRPKEGQKRMWIEILEKEGEVEMVVRDNGGGFKAQNSLYGTGTGMKVITQTIHLLNLYNNRPIRMQAHDVSLECGERGYEIRFVIPWGYSYQLKKEKNYIWKKVIKS